MPKFITPHRGSFKFQRAIPKSLRGAFGNRTIITHYLRGLSEPAALAQGRVLWGEYETQFRKLRELSPAEFAIVFAKGSLHGLKDATDTLAVSLDTIAVRETEDSAIITAEIIDSIPDVVEQGKALDNMKRVLKKTGTSAPSADLTALVDTWMKIRQPTYPTSRERKMRFVQNFIDVIGDVAPDEITQAHAVKFRNAMAGAGRAESYQRHHLAHLSALMAAAVDAGIVPANPFSGVRARKVKGKHVDKVKRKPFSGTQVAHVLAMAERSFGPEHLHDDLVWVLRLMAWHGARPGELAQLRKEDIRVEHDIPYMAIHDEDDMASVKNPQSVRAVPIHKRCAEFVDYAARAKGPQVFGFTFYKEGRYAGWLIRNFPKFRREVCGITDSKVVLYSLRHAWIDASRNTDMPEHIRRVIIGQKKEGGVLGGYGAGAALRERLKWLNKVDVLKG